MTLISTSSIFTPITKYIKFSNSDINVISGANVVSALSLCGIKINYEQFYKTQIVVPKNQTDFVISFPTLGIKQTFIAIKATYCANNPSLNFMKWGFQSSADPKKSFTNLLILTATTADPITNIVVDNLNPDCTVTLDILVGAMANDYINDISATLYLKDLTFDNIHTFNETNSEVFAFFNSDNEIAGTLDITGLINVIQVVGKNRIIIEDGLKNIVLDFLTTNDVKQAMSAILWLLADPANRALPKAEDTTAPVVTYRSAVIGNSMNVDLSLYSNNYTKTDFIAQAILQVIDNTDNIIYPSTADITFIQDVNNINVSINNIVNAGTYTVNLNITDVAGNIFTDTLTIIAQSVIIDTTAPVITYNPNVSGSNIDDIDINGYASIFTYNDAKVLSILSVTDDIDLVIALADVSTLFFDWNMIPVSSPITAAGHYVIRFTVQDTHSNVFTEDLSIYIGNNVIDGPAEVKYTSNVIVPSETAVISLSTDYGSGIGQFTPDDAVTYFISQIFDEVDGNITPLSSMVTFYNSINVLVGTIITPGNYTVRITVTDSALNNTIKNIALTVNV